MTKMAFLVFFRGCADGGNCRIYNLLTDLTIKRGYLKTSQVFKTWEVFIKEDCPAMIFVLFHMDRRVRYKHSG